MAAVSDPYAALDAAAGGKPGPSLLSQAKTTLGSAIGAVGDVLGASGQGVQHVIHGVQQGDLGEIARGAGILAPAAAGLVFGGPLGMIAGAEAGQAVGDTFGGHSRVDAATDIFGMHPGSGVGGFLEHAGLNAVLDPLSYVVPTGGLEEAGAEAGAKGIGVRLPFVTKALGGTPTELLSGEAVQGARDATSGLLRAADAHLPGQPLQAVGNAATGLAQRATNFVDPAAERISRMQIPTEKGGLGMTADEAAALEPKYAVALNQSQSAQSAVALDLKRGLSAEDAGAMVSGPPSPAGVTLIPNAGEQASKWDYFNKALERNGVPAKLADGKANPEYLAAQKLFTEQPDLATGPASRLFRQLNAIMPSHQLRYVVGDVTRNAESDISASFSHIQEARDLRTAVDDAAKLSAKSAAPLRVEDVAAEVFKNEPEKLAKWQALQQNGGFSGTLFHTETAGQGAFARAAQRMTQPAGGLSMDIRNGQTLARMEQGASPADAALATTHTMIGYTDLTPGIATARKYMAPFATHLAKSGALELEHIAANPGVAVAANIATQAEEKAKGAGGLGGKLASLASIQTPVQAALFKEPLSVLPQALSGNLRGGLATVGSSFGGPTLGGVGALSSRIGATKGAQLKAATQLITGTVPGAGVVAPAATAALGGDLAGTGTAALNTLTGLPQPSAALKAPGAPAAGGTTKDPYAGMTKVPTTRTKAPAKGPAVRLPHLPKLK